MPARLAVVNGSSALDPSVGMPLVPVTADADHQSRVISLGPKQRGKCDGLSQARAARYGAPAETVHRGEEADTRHRSPSMAGYGVDTAQRPHQAHARQEYAHDAEENKGAGMQRETASKAADQGRSQHPDHGLRRPTGAPRELTLMPPAPESRAPC